MMLSLDGIAADYERVCRSEAMRAHLFTDHLNLFQYHFRMFRTRRLEPPYLISSIKADNCKGALA